MQGLETTNTWLAVLTIASVVQTLLFVGFAVWLFSVYRRTVDAVERMEQRLLVPISAKVAHMVDEIEDLTTRARRVDDSVRGGVETANKLVWSMATRAWPVLGAARAVRAGLQVLGARTAHAEPTRPIDGEIKRRSEQVSQFERRKHNVS